jgi:hypothetical protein
LKETITKYWRKKSAPLWGVLAMVLAISSLTAWGVASPVGSSPDDDFHLASIWCGQGNSSNECEAGSTEATRVVPADLAYSICFAYNSETSGACQGETFNTGISGSFETARGNFTELYPPVFYYTMNFFVGPGIEKSVLSMRLFNILWLTSLSSLLFLFLPKKLKPAAIWSYFITLVPLGMFILPSTNPSSWAILAASGSFLSLLGALKSSGKNVLILGALTVVFTILGAGARGDQAIYNILGLVAALILGFQRNKRFARFTLFAMILSAVNFIFFTTTDQSSVVESGLIDGQQASNMSTLNLIFANLLEMPKLWVGIFGSWGLGWLDTPVPSVVWVAGLSAFVALIFTSLRQITKSKLIVVLSLFAAIWVIPTYVLVKTHALVGAYVQPRYVLPLIVLLAAVVLSQQGSSRIQLGRVQALTVVSALAVAYSLSLHFNLSRYLHGTDSPGWNLDSGIEWWWNFPISPMTIWAVGSLSFLLLLALSAQLIASKDADSNSFGFEWLLPTTKPV